MPEKNYDFRRRHWTVHQPDRRDAQRQVQSGELLLDSSWSLGCDSGQVMENAVRDFQDYLWVSMGISARRAGAKAPKTIWFEVDAALDRGFILDVSEGAVLVRLSRDMDAFRASVYLEDIMNLEAAPVLPIGRTVRRQLYDTRSVHSGCGLDEFPDEELLATVHAGYDTIVIFVKDIDRTTAGHCNINDVIQRAKRYGVGVMLYNYIRTFIHPDDPRAPEVFDAAYGELFRRYPDAIGVMLCGESLEFPSKDPHTTGKLYSESVVDGIPDTRPSPGWYPCEDYPAYLDGIAKAVHAVKPDAKVIFSTYNWAYQTPALRRNFLERMPKSLCLTVCYENTYPRTLEGLRTPVMDYTLSADKPGEYFKSECSVCKELGIAVQGNVNTSGIAWDFGCVPYVPAPYKLLNRMRILRQAHKQWGVSSHYATHHYGWWNCYAADLGKWSSWEDFEPDYDILLEKIAIRDYGREAAVHVLAAWKLWSEAMDYYVASNEDQYGPWRVGAAYPFIFQPNITRTMLPKEIQFPTAPHAHFGYRIIKTLYQPYENVDQAPGFLRYPAELRSLQKMQSLWEQGLAEAAAAGSTDNAVRLVSLGQFILCSIRTVIHIKRWWQENMKLQTASCVTDALAALDAIESLAHCEMQNVLDALPAVDADSRLGWEPSMEYVCDRWHLEWKQRQLESALREIAIYRSIVTHAYAEEGVKHNANGGNVL